jgi:N-acetylmuramoyl-L-alanine amidase
MKRIAAFALTCCLALPFAPQDASPLALSAALQAMRASATWDPLTEVCVVYRGLVPGDEAVSIKVGERNALFGRSTRVVIDAPFWKDGAVYIPLSTVKRISDWLDERDAIRASRFRVAAIIIDPGHGGKDGGAVGEHGSGSKRVRVLEKDVALTIGLDLYAKLKRAFPDRTVLMTRTGDTYPSLEERVEIANSLPLEANEAIIYISIHANASFNAQAKGFEVWYLNPDYERVVVDASKTDPSISGIVNSMLAEEYLMESVMLADAVLKRLEERVGDSSPNRGKRAEEWFVVRNARMPSILIEVGFVSNAQEAALLSDPAYLKKLSEAIYNGILDFVMQFEMQERH